MRRLVAVLGAAVLIASLQGIAAPSSAQALIGESLVLDGAGALTKGAETVLKSPGKVGEIIVDAGKSGGASAASAAEGTLASGGVLPAIGTAVGGFTAGWEIGTEICNYAGIEGCFHLFGNNAAEDVRTIVASPALGAGYWEMKPKAFLASKGQPAEGYIRFFGSFASPPWWGALASGNAGAECTGPLQPDPIGMGVKGVYESGVNLCNNPKGEKVFGNTYWAFRWPMQGLSVETTPSNNPAVPDLMSGGKPWVGDSKFGEKAKLPTYLKTPEGEKLGQRLAHELSPETVPDPYQTESTVPNCGGLTYAQCVSKLEFEGLEAVKNTLGWQTAKTDLAPDLVVQTAPAPGAVVATGSKVTVSVNPDEDGMPVLVPAPEAHETYDHYVARLPAALVPHRQTVPEAQIVPDAGPDAVLEVTPEPETRADPGGETDLNIRTNPNDAPPIGGAGGASGTCNATVGAIDWTPLNKPLGNKFPFGIFAFFVGWVGDWETGEGIAPEWELPLVPEGVFGSDGIVVHVEMAFLAPMVSVARVVFLFASFVGLLWFLGTAAAKLQGDSS